MDEEQIAGINEKSKVIASVYRGKEGGKPAYKTWLEAKAINPRITLDWTKAWFKKNVEPKNQVWGKRNSYVAPHAFFEYQVGLFLSHRNSLRTRNLRLDYP